MEKNARMIKKREKGNVYHCGKPWGYYSLNSASSILWKKHKLSTTEKAQL